MARKPRPTSPSTTPVAMTIEQFRSYLKGIMFVGGPDWCPTPEQWANIVKIIDNLVIPESVTLTTGSTSSSTAPPYGFDPYNPVPQYTLQPQIESILPPLAPQPLNIAPASPEAGDYQSPFI